MTANVFYVYVLFRPWDGSPCYVGKGKGNRWLTNANDGKHNRHLGFLVKKAKRLGMEIPRVKVRENLTEKMAFETEAAFIAAIGRDRRGPLVNLTAGGDGGHDPCDETRARMSAAAIKRTSAPEWRAKMSALKKGKKLSPEACARISAGHIGLVRSQEYRESMRIVSTGKKHSPEIREKMSLSAKKRDRSAGYSSKHKAAIRAGVTAYWQARRIAGLPLQHPKKDQ